MDRILSINETYMKNSDRKKIFENFCDYTKKFKDPIDKEFLEKIEDNSGNFSPEEILKRIYKHKCRRLLIEGGSKTVNIFAKNKYVNKFFFIQSEHNSKTKDPHTVNMVRSLCGNNFNRYNVKINLNNNKLFKI